MSQDHANLPFRSRGIEGEIRLFDQGKSSGVTKSRHKTLFFLPPPSERIRISGLARSMIFAITAFASSVPAASIARKIGVDPRQIAEHTNLHQVIRYLSVGRGRVDARQKTQKGAQKAAAQVHPSCSGLHGRQEMLFIVRRDSQPLGATPTIVEPGRKDRYGSSSTFPTSAGHVRFASDCSRRFTRVDSRSANTATAGARLAALGPSC